MTRYTTVSRAHAASPRSLFTSFSVARECARRKESAKQRQGQLNVWEGEGGFVIKHSVSEA